MYRTANPQSCILYIYSTNICTEYCKHGTYSPFFFSSKCSLFHNSNVFSSCVIHILYTVCAKIKKNNSDAKRLIEIHRTWNMKSKLMPVIMDTDNTWTTYQKSMKLRIYKKNSHIGRCTHPTGSTSVKAQTILHGRNNMTCSINCKYRTVAKLCTLAAWFFSGI